MSLVSLRSPVSLISSLSPLYGKYESSVLLKRFGEIRKQALWMGTIWACTRVALAITKILAPHHQIPHEFYGLVQLTITIPTVWGVFQTVTSGLYMHLLDTTQATKS